MKRVEDVLINIKRKRKISGYNLEEFAKLVGLSLSAYSKLENGQCPMTLAHFFKIAEALQIDEVKLFTKPL